MFCHKEPALILAAYALQADHGDHQPGNPEYFQPDQYIRESILSQISESSAKEQLPKMHQELIGMSKQEAEIEFVREAQKLPDYGIFFYGVAQDEKKELGSTVLGVSVGGIAIYEATGSKKSPVEKYSWSETLWVTYKEKRFTLVPKSKSGSAAPKRVFYTSTYKRSRYLLRMCTDLHHFRLVMAKKLQTESAIHQSGEPGLLTESDTDAETKSRSSLLVNALATSSSSLFDRTTAANLESSKQGDVTFAAEDFNEIKTVRLTKSDSGLGLMIVGGRDVEKGRTGIYVKSVKPGGTAARDGSLKPGCQLLEVNGEPLDGKSHSDVVQLLGAASSVVEMKFVQTSLAAAFERAATAEREKPKADYQTETQLEAIAEEELSGSGRTTAMSDLQSDQSQLLTVKLSKSNGGLGLKISGGVDTESRNGAIYIKELTAGGAAEKDGRLRHGDCLRKVDDHSLARVRHAQAVQILKETGNTVELEVERFLGMTETQEKTPVYRSVSGEVLSIELTKDEHGLGFGLVGGIDVSKPIIVKSLFPGQIAEQDGRLKLGDVLLEVNGKRVQSMSHKDVVTLLRQSPPLVRLVIQRPSEPIIALTSEPTRVKRKSPSPKNAQEDIQPASSALIQSSLWMVGSKEERSRAVKQEPQQQSAPPSRNESRESTPVDQDVGLVDVFGEKVLGKTFSLKLYRGVKGLGFSVTSGARSATDDSLVRGCFIRSVMADPALSDGRLQTGDQLLKVKNMSLRGMSHGEAVNVLRGTEGELMSLEVFRRMPPVSLPKTEEPVK
jgi:C-terminal processing protease CtpA/Prc